MMNIRVIMAAGAAALLLAGCGTTGEGGTPGGGAELSVSIVEPMGGTAVTVPFTVKVNSSVPLGTTASGLHHVHIYFDDNPAEYTLGESDTIRVEKAPTGSHRMQVSLRNADHTAAGAEAVVMIIVSGGGTNPSPTGGPTPGATGSGGYGDY